MYSFEWWVNEWNRKWTKLRFYTREWNQQFSCFMICCLSIAHLCLTLYDPLDCSIPGLPVLHYLLEFAQTHVYWIHDTILPSHPLSLSSPPAHNLSQNQGILQWVSCLHQVAKVLELQFQYQSSQRIFRVDFLQDWLVWSPCCPRVS